MSINTAVNRFGVDVHVLFGKLSINQTLCAINLSCKRFLRSLFISEWVFLCPNARFAMMRVVPRCEGRYQVTSLIFTR